MRVEISAVAVEESHVRRARKSALLHRRIFVGKVESVIFFVRMHKHDVFYDENAFYIFKIERIRPFFVRSDEKGFARIVVYYEIVSVCANESG